METWVQPLIELVMKIVFTAVGAGLVWLLARISKEAANQKVVQDAIDAIKQGVDRAQEEFVEWAKRSAADGKLSKDERAEARNLAFRYALQAARSQAVLDLIRSWTTDKINSIIADILTKRKGGQNVVTFVEVPDDNGGTLDRGSGSDVPEPAQ